MTRPLESPPKKDNLHNKTYQEKPVPLTTAMDSFLKNLQRSRDHRHCVTVFEELHSSVVEISFLLTVTPYP